MSSPVKAFGPRVAGFVVVASAEAQLLLTWETNITLTEQDLDVIHSAVTNQVHRKPAGTTATWSNPATRNSGVIKLVKNFVQRNQQCEEIEYAIRSGGT